MKRRIRSTKIIIWNKSSTLTTGTALPMKGSPRRGKRTRLLALDTAGAITYQQKLGDQVEILFLRVQKEATLKQRLLKRGDSMDSITKRINSPEYRRDMELPSELQGKATVIDNDDWQATKQKLDAFYLQVKKQTLDV